MLSVREIEREGGKMGEEVGGWWDSLIHSLSFSQPKIEKRVLALDKDCVGRLAKGHEV